MDIIRVSKEGFFNIDKNIFLEGINVCSSLRKEVEIDKDFCIRDLLNLLKKDSYLEDFFSKYSWCDLKNFYQLINKKSSNKHNIKNVLLKWIAIIDENNNLTHEFEMSLLDNDKEDFGCFGHYEEYLDCPIIISSASIYKKEQIFQGNICVSLLDFIDSILYELSFYGNVDRTNELINQLGKENKEYYEIEDIFKNYEDMFSECALFDIESDKCSLLKQLIERIHDINPNTKILSICEISNELIISISPKDNEYYDEIMDLINKNLIKL